MGRGRGFGQDRSNRYEEFLVEECRVQIWDSHVLISDNGTQFEGTRFEKFCNGLNIKHRFSSPGHLQAKVTNRAILDAMKKKAGKS